MGDEAEHRRRMAWIIEHGCEPEGLIRLNDMKKAGKLTDAEFQAEFEKVWEAELGNGPL
jgi:hypothetical protein